MPDVSNYEFDILGGRIMLGVGQIRSSDVDQKETI